MFKGKFKNRKTMLLNKSNFQIFYFNLSVSSLPRCPNKLEMFVLFYESSFLHQNVTFLTNFQFELYLGYQFKPPLILSARSF